MLIVADPAFSNRASNPYNSLLYQSLLALDPALRVQERIGLNALRTPAVLHLHWPEAFLHRPSALRFLLRGLRLVWQVMLSRVLGMPLVWTVHNLMPHEQKRPRASRWFYRWFPRRCAGLIFLSEATREAFQAADPALRSIPSVVIPHGHYRPVYPGPPSRAAARAALGLVEHERIWLFVGLIRPYKNVPALIQHFVAAALPQTRLLIAGRVLDNPALQAAVEAAAQGSTAVQLRLQHLSDETLAQHIAAADLVVLPYREIANSGTAILALSLNRPVLAPARGSLVELRQWIPGDWLRLYEGELTPTVLAQAAAASAPAAAVADLQALDWPRIAEQTLAFYRALLKPARG